MRLEFELEEMSKHKDGAIIYKVLRKGLEVGTLFLESPYGDFKIRNIAGE